MYISIAIRLYAWLQCDRRANIRYMVKPRVYYKLLVEYAGVTGTNYSPDYYPSYICMVEQS